MARKRSVEKVAALYQARLDRLCVVVSAELACGNVRTALRLVLGFAEDVAMDSDCCQAVERLQCQTRNLTPAQHDKLRATFHKAVLDAMGEIGLFLPEKRQ